MTFRKKFFRDDGGISFGTIILFLLLVYGVLVAFRVVPVLIRAYALIDFADEQTRFLGRRSAEELRQDIIDEARRKGIKIDERYIDISDSGSRLRTRIQFEVTLDFIFTNVKKKFDKTFEYPKL